MKKGSIRKLAIGLFVVFGIAALALPAHAFKWPKSLIFSVPAVGTGSHRMTSALAPILEKDTGMKVRVVPIDNESKRFEAFAKGRAQIMSMSISEAEMTISGIGAYADKPRIQNRILWHQNDTPWMFAAPGNTALKDIYAIKTTPGIKIANNNASTAMTHTVKGGLMDFLGMKETDVTIVPFGGYVANVRSIVEGKADVSLISPMSSVTHEIASSPIGVKWLDLPLTDKEGWKRFLPHRPTAIPAKITWGVKSAVGHYGYTSNFLYWISVDADPDLAYNLAKWIYEKYDLYSNADKALKRMHIDIWRAFLDYCPAPVHPSTIKYLREIGKWTENDDAWQADAIKLVTAYNDAWNKTVAEGKSKGVKMSTTNQGWLDLWAGHKKGLKRLASRMD
jgi:TRAP transporter TAXI family solute receptor